MSEINIWSKEGISWFIAFVIPGFVTLKAYDLLIPEDTKTSSEKIVDAIAYSCLVYAIMLLPIYLIEYYEFKRTSPILYVMFYILVLFLVPVALVAAWRYARTREFFQNIAPHPTTKPWDFVFSQRRPYWIKVKLKDGEVIAGKYGFNSFASSAPASEQLFLEECWVLNNERGFERAKVQSAGVIIVGSEIISVELYEFGETRGGDG